LSNAAGTAIATCTASSAATAAVFVCVLVSFAVIGQDLTWFVLIRTEDLDAVRQLLDEGVDPNQNVDFPGGSATRR
jgi:hypothetical protein